MDVKNDSWMTGWGKEYEVSRKDAKAQREKASHD